MQDKLKERFENESSEELYEPNLGHRQRFTELLDAEMKHSPEAFHFQISFKVMRVAAVAAILITAISFAWFWDQSKVNPMNPESLTLADISEKYSEVEFFYKEQMSVRLAKLETEDNANDKLTYKEALDKLNKLENDYGKLEIDLAQNPGNKRIVYAMIKNYQLRITVLETLLQKLNIEETQKTEENEKANVSPLFPVGIHLVSLSA